MKKDRVKSIFRKIFIGLVLTSLATLSTCFYLISSNFYQGQTFQISKIKDVTSRIIFYSLNSNQAAQIVEDINLFDESFNKKSEQLEVALRMTTLEEREKDLIGPTLRPNQIQSRLMVYQSLRILDDDKNNIDFQGTLAFYRELELENKGKSPVVVEVSDPNLDLERPSTFFSEREVATITMSSARDVSKEVLTENNDSAPAKKMNQVKEDGKSDDLVFYSSDEVLSDSFNSKLTEEKSVPGSKNMEQEQVKHFYESIVGSSHISDEVQTEIDKHLVIASNSSTPIIHKKEKRRTKKKNRNDRLGSLSTQASPVADQKETSHRNLLERVLGEGALTSQVGQVSPAKKSSPEIIRLPKKATVNLSVFEVSLDKGVNEKAQIPYDVTQSYDVAHLFDHDFLLGQEGIAQFQTSLNENYGSLPIIINGGSAGDYFENYIDLALEGGHERSFEIPLFIRDDFESFIRKKQPEIFNYDYGFVVLKLINLNHLSESKNAKMIGVEVGRKSPHDSIRDYCFDGDFKFLGEELDDSCHYYLISGLIPGNRDISYQLKIDGRTEVSTKVIHVPANKVYYEETDFKLYKGNVDEVNLFEHHLTALELSDDLRAYSEVKSFTNVGKDLLPKASSNHSFEILHPVTPFGSRHYFSLYRDGEDQNPVYVGKNDSTKVIVPTEEYREYRLNEFVGDDLISDREIGCVIQVNTSKPILDFHVSGYSDTANNSHMGLSVRYWDSSGYFSEKAPLASKNAFILGNYPGVVIGRIQYQDNSNDYFISHCGSGTYLIEQF